MTAKELRTKVLEVLTAWGSLETTALLTKLDIPLNRRPAVLKFLHKMVEGGFLIRKGIGKFHWSVTDTAVSTYTVTKEDIYTVTKEDIIEATKATSSDKYAHKITGYSFPHRIQLKGLGCFFKKNTAGAYWYAPSEMVRQHAQAIVDGGDPPSVVTGTTVPGSLHNSLVDNLHQKIKDLELTVAAQKAAAELYMSGGTTHKTVTIKVLEDTVAVLKNVTLPKTYQRVLDLATARRNVLLVGPAGCGKTYLGKLISKSLGLAFGSISCTSGMSEAHLLGRSIPDFHKGVSRFQGTEFLNVYENGGVFLLDELDAADPNMLLAINSAIANGYCNVPNRPENPVAIRHKDFVLIATANTFGRGASRSYSGRNQLDEATLDRFRIGIVECNYDPAVEAVLCPTEEIREPLQKIRERIEAAGLRRCMSTRFMEDAYTMSRVCDWSLDMILNSFFEGWTADERHKVTV